MAMSLSWAPIDGALITAGTRQSSINLLWRLVPDDERTPVRRKLVIALVDHVREHHERTGQVSPSMASTCDVWLSEPREPQEVCPCGHYMASHTSDGCHRCTSSSEDVGPEDFACRRCGAGANELRHYRTVTAGDAR